MKVWEIKHYAMGRGWTCNDPKHFEVELEEEVECQGEEESNYTKAQIKPFLDKCKAMNVDENLDLGIWSVKCFEMTEEEYNNLPEFTGW